MPNGLKNKKLKGGEKVENEKKPKKVKGPAWLILLGLGIAVFTCSIAGWFIYFLSLWVW